jgi:heat shock protein HtpX
MVMNFWEAQKRARSKTTIYLLVFVLLTISMAILLEIAMRTFADQQYQFDYPAASLLFLCITFGVAAFQYLMFQSHGGKVVAQSVGGRRVLQETTDPQERQLLNIVEELAISASLPVPPVYILPANQINAFAAGLNPQNAVIAITQGALIKLNRDEVQGVIAHELGHIYNGDMKISMRLAAMVMGFFFVLYIAFRLLHSTGFVSRRSSRQNGNQGQGANPVLLLAILMICAGAISWFIGSILKATISREREYLADACSVQFTRNPPGIANALKKIGKDQVNDMPAEGMAFSHMYFNEPKGLSALFASHPPLRKRIEAIEGGRYDFSKRVFQ